MNKAYVPLFFVVFSHAIFSSEIEFSNQIGTHLKNPIFLNYDPSVLGQININHYEFDEIKRLELLDKVSQVLRNHSQFNKCDRMFMMWLCSILKNAKTEDEAVEEWYKVAKNNNKTIENLTSIQKQLIYLPKSDIKKFYKLAQDSIKNVEPELTHELLVRVLKRHQWHDKHQTNAIPLRNLAIVKDRKINISLLKNCLSLVKKLHEEDTAVPIYERLKNLKVFHVNDFYASKGSLIVHDIFDHFWFGLKLEEAGIFHKYKNFFKTLGSPQLYDLFSREGELYASIAFDFRSFQQMEDNYSPLFNIDDIRNFLKEASTQNQKKALEIINKSDNPEFLKQLSYILSGMSIELMESNRKAGFIKTLDEKFRPTDYFNFFDPEHIAFVVEAVDVLFKQKDAHLQLLTNITLYIEKYLSDVAVSSDVTRLVIGLDELNKLAKEEADFSSISLQRIEWIKKNKGFESIRYSIN